MQQTYSIYEAKAKLSEIIRQVKQERSVVITERGQEVAMVIPFQSHDPLARRLEGFMACGILQCDKPGIGLTIHPVERKKGALQRFLDSRNRL